MPRWLPLQSNGGVNVQMVRNEIGIYAQGFVCIPCKHINILPKELNQLTPLQLRQLSPNLKELFQIITNNYLF